MIDFFAVKEGTIPEGEVKQIAKDGVVLWKGGYTNLVPTSKDTDGSVFNGVGYRDGYRLSSSGSLSAQNGKTVSGFIPCKSTDLIRLSGVDWFPPDGYCYLVFYDSNLATLGSVNVYVNSTAASGYLSGARGIVRFKSTTNTPMDIHPSESNGVFTFDQITFTDGSAVAYFRINGHGNGENMIVTVNEEIT